MGKRKKKEANLNMPRRKRADELAAAAAKEAQEEARLGEVSADVPMADLVASFADELRCGLCAEIFTDPCTLPCGHNFCRACAEERLHGKGVYKNECPHERCTQPCYVKDLERNHTIASIVSTLRDGVAPFAPGFDRARGRGGLPGKADTKQKRKKAAETDVAVANGDDGKGTTAAMDAHGGVPTLEECARLVKEIREIDAVSDYLRRELTQLRAKREAREAKEAKRLLSRASVDAGPRVEPQVGTQTKEGGGAVETQTQTQTQAALGQCARLNMTQARHLYLMAHGTAPKKGTTLKKLRAAAAVFDPDVVAAVLSAQDGDDEDPGSNPASDEHEQAEARRKRRETVAAERATLIVPPGERRRAVGVAPPSRVFTFTQATGGGKENAAATTTNAGESNKSRFAADVARLNRLDPDGAIAVYAEEVGASTPLPRAATHLLFDNGRRFDNFTDASRVVAKRTVRYLEAVLRGVWVIHVDYMKDCASAGKWLDEREYELRDAGITQSTKFKRKREAIGVDGSSDALDALDPHMLELGPPGGRKRAAEGAIGVFVGERVRVASLPADVPVTLTEFSRLLELGGAVVSIGPASDLPSPPSPSLRVSDSQDQVPESQPFGCEFGGTQGGVVVSAVKSGQPPTAIVVSDIKELDGDVARRDLAVDWHWVFHSIVHHRALDKEPYLRALLETGNT